MAGDEAQVNEDKNSILLSDDGLTSFHQSQVLFKLRWSEVKEIVAYKEDCFGFDSICIGFRAIDADEYLRVFEEADGYKELIAELERRFPDIRKDWFNEVAFPAFEPNWTTIWGQPMANNSK